MRSSRPGLARPPSHGRFGVLASRVLLPVALTACSDPSAPAQPPYLAIVTHLTTLPGVVPPARLSYHVKELSGALRVNTRIDAAPSDTVILPVPPATYVITAQDIPATCYVREGVQRAIVLTPQDNTGLIRYVIQCRGALTVVIATDGHDPDDGFIYHLRAASGYDRTGTTGANDTLVFNRLPASTYTLRLAGVASNCVVTNDGGKRLSFAIDSAGGTLLNFRVQCARESERPQVRSFASSYGLGSSAFVLRVHDPNRDVDGYTWDLTDCNGHSILPDKRERIRRGLMNGRTRFLDSLTIVGAYDVGLPSAEMIGKCTQIRVFDFEANSSELLEHRIGSSTGRAPFATSFNAQLVGTAYVRTDLTASDLDDDFLGVFLNVRLRDGTLGPPDGQPDVGLMDPAGYLTAEIPPIPTTGRLEWDDVYAVILWLIDERGNALRLEDADVFK